MSMIFAPGSQFFNSNGDSVAAGSLTFFDTGTTNEKAVYSDSSLSIEAANPYTLDSSGRIAVNLYGSGTYTVILKDSTGATVWSRDDVFGWQEFEAGSVKAFGAVGDGVTDDTAAIQAAATALAAYADSTSLTTKNKPTLWFPNSDGYLITGPITIAADINVKMDGPILVSSAADAVGTWLTIGVSTVETRNLRLDLDVRRITQSDWSDSADIGIRLLNVCASEIKIRRADRFYTGAVCDSTGTGAAWYYNHIHLGEFRGNRQGLHLTSGAGSAGAVNQNQFYGGEFACSSGYNVSDLDRYGIVIDRSGTPMHNSNTFVGQSYELNATLAGTGEAVPVLCSDARYFRFLEQRAEGCDVPFARLSGDCRFITFESNYDSEFSFPTELQIDDDSTYKIGNAFVNTSDWYPGIGKLFFATGALGRKAVAHGSSLYGIEGLEWAINTNPATFTRYGALASVNAAGSVTFSTTFPGVRVKRNGMRSLALVSDSQNSTSPTVYVLAFDSGGTKLTADTDVLQNVSTPTLTANTGVYGGLYSMSGALDTYRKQVVVTFSDNVDTFFISVGGSGAECYGWQLYALNGNPYPFTGSSEVVVDNGHLRGFDTSNGPAGTCTLTANAASTAVSNTAITANSLVFLMPVTANAAADIAAGNVYISAKSANTSFTITHPNNANVDKTFNYWIVN